MHGLNATTVGFWEIHESLLDPVDPISKISKGHFPFYQAKPVNPLIDQLIRFHHAVAAFLSANHSIVIVVSA